MEVLCLGRSRKKAKISLAPIEHNAPKPAYNANTLISRVPLKSIMLKFSSVMNLTLAGKAVYLNLLMPKLFPKSTILHVYPFLQVIQTVLKKTPIYFLGVI